MTKSQIKEKRRKSLKIRMKLCTRQPTQKQQLSTRKTLYLIPQGFTILSNPSVNRLEQKTAGNSCVIVTDEITLDLSSNLVCFAKTNVCVKVVSQKMHFL